MTLANVKGMVAKAMVAAVAAGALMMAAPAKAEAQGFRVGLRFGAPPPAPFYGRPGYYGPGYYGFDRREAIIRHDELVRHEEWERAHRFHPYGYYR